MCSCSQRVIRRCLTVLDEYSREALCVAVKPRMGNAEVLEALYPLFLKHGRPEFIRSDNGPEFIAENFQTWLTRVGIKPIHIYPGSPWENGYNERFNGTLRREVLNAERFTSIRQAQVVIETWPQQYNHIRPHQALNMKVVGSNSTHEIKNNLSNSICCGVYLFQGNENSKQGRENCHLNCRFFHC